MSATEDRPVALITGGAQGLGWGVAAALGTAGYAVALLDIDGSGALDGCRRLQDRGIHAIGLACDVTDPEEVSRSVSDSAEQLGRLDVVVNNAQATRIGPILEIRPDDARTVLESGLLGTLHVMQAAFPHLAATRGCVVNVSSGAALTASAGYGIYAATKEAIRTLSRVAAVEFGPSGVRVNVVIPSARTAAFDQWATDHPGEAAERLTRIPLGRIGDAELDVGPAVVFLAGDASRYITGTTLVVDGGTHHLR